MASLVRRRDSPHWWISYVDRNDKRLFKSTGYRRDDPLKTKLAWALEAEMTSREKSRDVVSDNELWAKWVGDFLPRHASGRTLEKYISSWKHLYAFLREKEIRRARDFTYQDALNFLTWRTAQKRRGGKPISLNTALQDMKTMRIVMTHGIRLFNLNIPNPCARLGVKKAEAQEKPELTDQDVRKIREALDKVVKAEPERDWMRDCFEIALNTGCRLRETRVAMRLVDIERKTITFDSPKGGKKRAFSVPLPTALIPRLSDFKAAGRQWTVDFPISASRDWWDFWTAHFKGSNFCLHCTRVTFVTRLFRAGVPEAVAMKLVNHSSTLVHKIYQRLGVEDVRQFADKVVFSSTSDEAVPSPAATSGQSSR